MIANPSIIDLSHPITKLLSPQQRESLQNNGYFTFSTDRFDYKISAFWIANIQLCVDWKPLLTICYHPYVGVYGWRPTMEANQPYYIEQAVYQYLHLREGGKKESDFIKGARKYNPNGWSVHRDNSRSYAEWQ